MAAGQRGLITRTQLLAAGISAGAIDGRLEAGRLHPIHRGVYALGHPALAPLALEQAALLACGSRAVLSHLTAAVLWELVHGEGRVIHVTVVAGQRRAPSDVVVHRAASAETTLRHGLRVTTARRTLIDLAATGHPSLPRALNEAQVKRLVSLDALLKFAGRRPGARILRDLATESPGYTRSGAERLMLALVRRADLPRPRTNVRLGRYEIDAFWPEQRLAVEVDGYAAHSTRQAFERDRIRDADIQLAGHRVLRITWDQLTRRPEAVAVRLALALAR